MEIELFITYPSLLLTISIKNSGTCRILLIELYFQVLIVTQRKTSPEYVLSLQIQNFSHR